MSKHRPGIEAVNKYIATGSTLTQAEICHKLASEVRAEINALWANDNGPTSGRHGKKARDQVVAKINGLKIALTLALGHQLGYPEEIEEFLETFKQERLTHSRAISSGAKVE